jgi:hypothetical protein
LTGLDFDMDQDPLFRTAIEPDFHQLVDETPPDFCLAHDFLELFVERLGVAAPVDVGVRLGAEQLQKRLEEDVQGLFPWAVIICQISPLSLLPASPLPPIPNPSFPGSARERNARRLCLYSLEHTARSRRRNLAAVRSPFS